MNSAMNSAAQGSAAKQPSCIEQYNMRLDNLLSDNRRALSRLEDMLVRLRGLTPKSPLGESVTDPLNPTSHFGKMSATIDDLFKIEARMREVLADLEELA